MTTKTAVLFCTECGQELASPGAPCPACPQLDDRRRAVMARYQGQIAELRAIDSEENARALAEAAGAARALVTPVRAAVRTAEAAVTEAIGAERDAADRLRGAEAHLRKVTRAEAKARRDQAGVEKLTESLMRMRAAADITGEVRAATEQATRARQTAEQARDQHLARLSVLEDDAAAAERAAANPPPAVPPSVWTCLLGAPLALLMQPDLGAEGRVLVGAQIASLAKIAGVADELRAEGRGQAEAELTDRGRHPGFLRPTGPGQLAALANPAHPSTPAQRGMPGGLA
jgi:hypothetical protein